MSNFTLSKSLPLIGAKRLLRSIKLYQIRARFTQFDLNQIGSTSDMVVHIGGRKNLNVITPEPGKGIVLSMNTLIFPSEFPFTKTHSACQWGKVLRPGKFVFEEGRESRQGGDCFFDIWNFYAPSFLRHNHWVVMERVLAGLLIKLRNRRAGESQGL